MIILNLIRLAKGWWRVICINLVLNLEFSFYYGIRSDLNLAKWGRLMCCVSNIPCGKIKMRTLSIVNCHHMVNISDSWTKYRRQTADWTMFEVFFLLKHIYQTALKNVVNRYTSKCNCQESSSSSHETIFSRQKTE